jgi:adenosine deaminase/adenosine deaminase CECR1
LLFLLLLLLPASFSPATAQNTSAIPEQRTARHFERIKSRPLELYSFLREMPKGGDLHSHLSGAVYAESYVKWAAEAGLCVNTQTLLLSNPPCDPRSQRPPASTALTDTTLHRRLIDSWSMRNWHYSGQNGHDQFFDTFGKFGPAGNNRYGDMLAEVVARAASGRVSYVELMLTPDNGKSREIGRQVDWTGDLAGMRQALIDKGISQAVREGSATLDEMDKRKRDLLKCDESSRAEPGCGVTARFIFQISRSSPPREAFAQMVAAMEMAAADSRLVGLNLVQAEDTAPALANFDDQMRMLDYLHSVYPKVQITLHAGELAPGLVPPEDLRSHIRDSVRKGHAKRIGHGVDIMFEDQPYALLREMAEKRVMVEICLTSNDVILGVRGKRHPLSTYIEHGVPVALATDDEGVSRSEMTREYVKAVEEQGLSYSQLKTMARTSLEHAFIAGRSLWANTRRWTTAGECSLPRSRTASASPACRRFLDDNPKARLQWELESAFSEFERGFPSPTTSVIR